jgi:hypothetical protein
VDVLAPVGAGGGGPIDLGRAHDAWNTLAIAADLPRDSLGSPEAIRTALARRHADVLHAQHRFAPRDALPLLARASPAIAALPAGSVRRATYADTHWTIELQPIDAEATRALEERLRAANLAVMVAATAGGVRVRAGAR